MHPIPTQMKSAAKFIRQVFLVLVIRNSSPPVAFVSHCAVMVRLHTANTVRLRD
jgi:hypothetical protein